ncbi:MAG: hypothetical protein ABIU38_16430, partial [Vicinamibacteraceae bacterium]
MGYDVRRHHFESAGIVFGVGACALAIANWRRYPTHATSSRESAIAIAVPVTVALAAFWWTLDLGPLSDDFVLQRWARSGVWSPNEWAHLRPLPLALWQLTFASGGGWVAVHALNVALHAINVGLVAALAGTLITPRAGLVAGVTFALVPSSIEAVAWSAGIFDLLATLCVLGATFVWIRWPAGLQQALVVLICSAAGVLSKETAFGIPLLLAGAALFRPARGALERRMLLRTWALAVVMTGGLLAWRTVYSPAVGRHLYNLPADQRAWKDFLVRPFAALAVPFRTEAG